MMVKGFVSIKRFEDAEGKPISNQQAYDYGWVNPSKHEKAAGWNLAHDEIGLGPNLFLDNGRQMMAYAFGFRNPIANYSARRFGVGSGTTAPKVTDTGLEAVIQLSGSDTKLLEAVNFPAPFIAEAELAIGATEAVGYLITELGIFTDNGTILARTTHPGINKSADFAPVLGWRFRF